MPTEIFYVPVQETSGEYKDPLVFKGERYLLYGEIATRGGEVYLDFWDRDKDGFISTVTFAEFPDIEA